LNNWNKLIFSPPIEEHQNTKKKINPKRMQREISPKLQAKGIDTKAQQALKFQ